LEQNLAYIKGETMKKYHVFLLSMLSVTALAQTPKPPVTPPPAPAQATPVPPKPSELTPKESEDNLKLQLALQTEKSITLEATNIQKSIEPQIEPLRQQYAEQEAIVAKESDAVRKDNGWGQDAQIDRNPNSPTFGKWIKKETPPAPSAPKK
jgi:hypothetical protein